jgi:hypothetical protein
MVEKPSHSQPKKRASVNAAIAQNIEARLLRNYFLCTRGQINRLNLAVTIRRYRRMLEGIRRKMNIEAAQKNIGLPVSGTLKKHARIIQQGSRGHACLLDY